VRQKQKIPPPLLDPAVLSLVASRFRVLGDPSRLCLLNLLIEGEASVNDLVTQSGLSQTNVSRHLGLLRRDGLVSRTPDGNRAVYRINDHSIEKLCRLVCGGLSDQLNEGLDTLHGVGI
jgi:DNA-binding transcriptional ArsR family regulator